MHGVFSQDYIPHYYNSICITRIKSIMQVTCTINLVMTPSYLLEIGSKFSK